MGRLNFRQKFSDRVLINILRYMKIVKYDGGEDGLFNPNLSLKDLIKYNRIGKSITLCLVLSHRSLKGKNLEKAINLYHRDHPYCLTNPNLTAEIIRRNKDIDWDVTKLSKLGILSLQEIEEIFPHYERKDYICHSKYLTDELIQNILKDNEFIKGPFNANSQVSLEFILNNRELVWHDVDKRSDVSYQIYFKRQFGSRFMLVEILRRIKSKSELIETMVDCGLPLRNIDLYSIRAFQINDIMEFHQTYGILLHKFASNLNLTFKFILDNFKGNDVGTYFDLQCNKFTLEKKMSILKFKREHLLYSLVNLEF